MGLAEFLAARLDEDQAGARFMRDREARGLQSRADFMGSPLAERMLREVEAKRKILKLLEAAETYDDKSLGVATLRMVAKTFATVWSDHPDYDPAWKD
jgi:Family of unknown function (DUF6221)